MTSLASVSSAGMAFVRSPVGVGIEPFYGEVIAGLETVLHKRGINVLMQVVESREEELSTYRRWAATRAVAGVVLTNLTMGDARAELTSSLGLPSVTLGEPAARDGMAVVRVDNFGAMTNATRELVKLGHSTIARVSGPIEFVHTQARTAAFDAAVAEASVTGSLYVGDYSADSGSAAMHALLARAVPPTAVIFDNDVMAVAALEAAQRSGVSVPEQLSILAWDDSALCRMTMPQLSAMSHDVNELGVLAAHALLSVIDGHPALDVVAPEPQFIGRGTTAPTAPAHRSAGQRILEPL